MYTPVSPLCWRVFGSTLEWIVMSKEPLDRNCLPSHDLARGDISMQCVKACNDKVMYYFCYRLQCNVEHRLTLGGPRVFGLRGVWSGNDLSIEKRSRLHFTNFSLSEQGCDILSNLRHRTLTDRLCLMICA